MMQKWFCLWLLVLFSLQSQAEEPSIDQKIGQMLMMGFRGLEANNNQKIIDEISKGKIGGVVFFLEDGLEKGSPRNIQSPKQLQRLTRQLQTYPKIPIFIALDQEGGIVNRLPAELGFPSSVSADYLGEMNDISVTEKYSVECSDTLCELGINLNLAPVVDLKLNPLNTVITKRQRSFSKDPLIVVKHAAIFVDAHHKKGILNALKHFPGHGSSYKDSHEGFVDITNTWDSKELEPYRFFIQQGFQDFIMTAHVFHKKLDPDFPATLSSKILTDLLRKELNFKGVIISDDLQMGAIQKNYGLEMAIEKAINAGIDILLFANQQVYDEEISDKAHSIIKKLITEGKLSEERIQESFSRIIHLKQKMQT